LTKPEELSDLLYPPSLAIPRAPAAQCAADQSDEADQGKSIVVPAEPVEKSLPEPHGAGSFWAPGAGGEEGGRDRAARRRVKGRGAGGFGGGLLSPAFTLFGGGGRRGGGWGGGRGSDREARAPRPRVERAAAMRRDEGYYWRPVRQSYALAWPSVIGRPTTSAVPFRSVVRSRRGRDFQLIAGVTGHRIYLLLLLVEDENSPRF